MKRLIDNLEVPGSNSGVLFFFFPPNFRTFFPSFEDVQLWEPWWKKCLLLQLQRPKIKAIFSLSPFLSALLAKQVLLTHTTLGMSDTNPRVGSARGPGWLSPLGSPLPRVNLRLQPSLQRCRLPATQTVVISSFATGRTSFWFWGGYRIAFLSYLTLKEVEVQLIRQG